MVHQRNEVLPLRHRGVLKLVDEHVPETAAHAFEQKRHRVVAHHPRNAFVQGVERPNVAAGLHVFHLLGNGGEGPDQINLVDESFAQEVGLPFRRSGGHVGHLDAHGLRFRQHATHRRHRVVRRLLRGEHPFVEHRLQGRRRGGGLALTLLSNPFEQRAAHDVFVGQAFSVDGGHRLGGLGLEGGLHRANLVAEVLGDFPKVRRFEVAKGFQGRPHPLLEHLSAVRGQGVTNSAVLLLFHLQPGKALQHFGEFLLARRANAVQHVRHSFFDDAVLVQLDAVVLVQGQIPRETLDQPVREAVQRHDRHVPVPVQHRGPHGAGAGAEGERWQVGLGFQLLHKAVCPLVARPNAGQVTQDALLHFPSGLVGEGQGQNVPKRARLVVHQAARQVPAHEPVSLSRSGRRTDHFKRLRGLHVTGLPVANNFCCKLAVIPS